MRLWRHKLLQQLYIIYFLQPILAFISFYDIKQFLGISYNLIASTVNRELLEHKGLKIKCIINCEMVKTNIVTGENTYADPHFHSNVEVILRPIKGGAIHRLHDEDDFDEPYTQMQSYVLHERSRSDACHAR